MPVFNPFFLAHQVEAQICGNLIIPASAGVEFERQDSDLFLQRFLHVGVHIFCLAAGDGFRILPVVIEHRTKPLFHLQPFRARKNTGPFKRPRIGQTSFDIRFQQSTVKSERVIELREKGIFLRAKTSSPQLFSGQAHLLEFWNFRRLSGIGQSYS